MIMGIYFDGDVFDDVQRLQHDLYGESLGRIYFRAVKDFKRAEATLQQRTELGDLHPLADFDHRTLQFLHDRIAAFFRYTQGTRLHPELDGASSLPHEARIKNLWLNYLEDELTRVFETYPTLIRLILEATAFPNPERRGIEAEEAMEALLRGAYIALNG